MRRVFYITVFLALCFIGLVVGGILFTLMGCQTPYGVLGSDAIEDYVETSNDGLICVSDGFDSVCIQTIPGPRGPRGRDGAVVTLEVERIVKETVREVFVLQVFRTEMTYHTPVGAVYVPEDAPVVAPEGVKVTPVPSDARSDGGGRDQEIVPTGKEDGRDQEIVPTGKEDGRDQEIPPTGREDGRDQEIAPTEDGTIWHVMYRNENGRMTVYVYPRESDIQTVPPLAISDGFSNEIQGTREQVNDILAKTLSADNATLGSVGGVQGIVN